MNGLSIADLLLGTTALLALGCVASYATRGPLARQRVGEATVLCVLAWLALALVPLPRWAIDATPIPAVTPATAPAVAAVERPAAAPVRAPTAPPLDATAISRALPDVVAPTAAASGAAFVPPPRARGDGARRDVPPPASHSSLELTDVALGLYASGALLVCTWLALGRRALKRTMRATRTAPMAVTALADALWTRGRRPRMTISDTVDRPFCTGALRPTIVLPAALLTAPNDVLRAVLLHEFAHVRHGHLRTHHLFAAATIALWPHPLYWLIRARTRFATETCADADAASRTDRTAYVRALLDLAETVGARTPHLPAALPAIGRRSNFYRRMTMLIERRRTLALDTSPRGRVLRGIATAGVLALAVGLWGRTPLNAQDPVRAPRPELVEQMRALQAERDALAAQIAQLRQDMIALKHAIADAPAEEAPPKPKETDLFRRILDQQATAEDAPPDAAKKQTDLFRRLFEAQAAPEAVPPDAGDPFTRATPDRRDPRRPAPDDRKDGALDTYLRNAARYTEARDLYAQAARTAANTQRAPTAPAGASASHVIELTMRAVDLRGALEKAEHRLAETRELADNALVSKRDLRDAELELNGARRKFEVVQVLLHAERESVDFEIAAVEAHLVEAQDAPEAIKAELNARLRRLIGLREALAAAD